MEIKFLNQPKDVKIGEVLTSRLINEDYSKVWIFAGFAKDSGLDYLLEAVKVAREKGTIIECILGLDKKSTSKDMLLKLLNLGCKIRFHINDDETKLETRIYAFESEVSDSLIYLTGSKLSEGGLTENISLITEIKYSSNEKKEFNKAKLSIESGINNEKFEILNEEKLKELASAGEILARITERKIPSISQLYNASEIENAVQEYDENSTSKYNEIVKKDIEIEIDFTNSLDIKVQNTLGEEVEQKIKREQKTHENSAVTSKLVLNERDINYDTMSTLIIPISKVVKKGATSGEIKIPVAIALNMHKFFGYPQNFHMEEDEKGKLKEIQKIKLEIFENLSQSCIDDKEAKIIQTDKNIILKSLELINLEIEDNDIMRLIKQDDNKYKCEIIRQGSPEYNIWENFCVTSVKGTSKKFGIM